METVLNKSTPYPRDLSVKIFSRAAVLKKKIIARKTKNNISVSAYLNGLSRYYSKKVENSMWVGTENSYF